MNKLIESKFNSNKLVLATLEHYNSIYAHIPVMVENVNILKNLIQDTNNLSAKVQNIPHKVAGNKSITRAELAIISNKISNILLVYANMNHEQNLQDFLITSENVLLKQMRGREILDYAKNVLDRAIEKGEALNNYGITPEMINELSTGINDFEGVIAQPRELIAKRKTHNELMTESVVKASDIIEDKIDPFMELFKNNKEFYLEYKTARIAVDPASRSRKEATEDINE